MERVSKNGLVRRQGWQSNGLILAYNQTKLIVRMLDCAAVFDAKQRIQSQD